MDHEPVLISTIAVGLVAAFVGGYLAKRIGLPTIVGYIVAGVVLGPFTPGFIADTAIAVELADIGIILLMFGVGIHFSIRDLAAVRSIAIPGRPGPDRRRDPARRRARDGARLGHRRRPGARTLAVRGAARSCCSARSRIAASSTRPRAGSPSVG